MWYQLQLVGLLAVLFRASLQPPGVPIPPVPGGDDEGEGRMEREGVAREGEIPRCE